MKRRVIKQGNNTLTITLPRDWCDRFAVKAGDELHLDEAQHKLIVSPAASAANKEIEIEIPKGGKFHRRYVTVPYAHGFDRIRIIYHDPSLFAKIQNSINLLVGFEMTEQGDTYCLFQNVAVPVETEFDNMHNRLLHVAADMLESCADAIKKHDSDRFAGIIAMEQQANRFHAYCRRTINKMALEQSRVTARYTINRCLDVITDAVRDLCVSLQEKPIKVDDRISALLKKYAELVRLIKTLQDKRDNALLGKFVDTEKALDKQLDAIASSVHASNAVLLLPLSGIKESLHMIGEEF